MGVMGCSRHGCAQIMCDLYIEDVGYVCYECKSEFKEYLEQMNEDEDNMYEKDIKARLKHFMSTSKGDFTEGAKMSVDDFFNRYKDEEH